MMMRQLQITVMVPSEFKSCHDNVIILNTFTLPFSVVISRILVVMTYMHIYNILSATEQMLPSGQCCKRNNIRYMVKLMCK